MNTVVTVQSFILNAIGGSIATLINPWILVSGFIVAKQSPRTAEFWLWVFMAIIACLFIGFTFDTFVNDVPLDQLFAKRTAWTALAVVGRASYLNSFESLGTTLTPISRMMKYNSLTR